MDINVMKNKAFSLFQKYKFALIIVLVGIVLMLIPSHNRTETKVEVNDINDDKTQSVEEELENILSSVQGVGTVKVMLKESVGTETIYETNHNSSSSDLSTDTKTEIVTVTDSQRNENGLIKQVNPPQYLGAIIICQGANDPKVRLVVTDAVSKITGLGADKIAVLNMK